MPPRDAPAFGAKIAELLAAGDFAAALVAVTGAQRTAIAAAVVTPAVREAAARDLLDSRVSARLVVRPIPRDDAQIAGRKVAEAAGQGLWDAARNVILAAVRRSAEPDEPAHEPAADEPLVKRLGRDHVRIANALEAAGILTVGDLASRWETLPQVRTCGDLAVGLLADTYWRELAPHFAKLPAAGRLGLKHVDVIRRLAEARIETLADLAARIGQLPERTIEGSPCRPLLARLYALELSVLERERRTRTPRSV